MPETHDSVPEKHPSYDLSISDSDKVKSGEISCDFETKLEKIVTAEDPVLDALIDFSESSKSGIENILNKRRLEQFRETHLSELLRIIREQDFEYGFNSSADLFVRELMNLNSTVTKEWINAVFLDYFDDPKIIIGLLQIISHIAYFQIEPQGPTMAIAALKHADAEVRECGIRAFENWSVNQSLMVLSNVKCHEKWLQDYLDQVISDLQEEQEKNAAAG